MSFVRCVGVAVELGHLAAAKQRKPHWRQCCILESGPWLKGRSANIVVAGKAVGQCGEIDPYVAEIFDLKVPMSGAQFDMQALQSVIADPVH